MQTTQNQITPENPNSIGGQASMSLKVDSVGDSRMESILVKIAQYKETIKFDRDYEFKTYSSIQELQCLGYLRVTSTSSTPPKVVLLNNIL